MVVESAYSDEEILVKVKKTIAEILAMELNEIAANSSLVDDFGVESSDFLDLTIRLEETFNVFIPRRPPLQRAAEVLGREKLIQVGKLTPMGAKLLKVALPEVDQSRIYEGMPEGDTPSLITPQTYVNVVKRGLELARWHPEECQKCRAKDFTSVNKDELEFPEGKVPPGPVFRCNPCNNMIFAPPI